MDDRSFHVGALGTGRVFNHAHLPAYVNLKNVELVALYDADHGAAEQTRERDAGGCSRVQPRGRQRCA